MALADRAGKRIKEGTGFHASTIAGFLENAEIQDDERAIIIIDETSMVDLHTIYKVVMDQHNNVRILLVGNTVIFTESKWDEDIKNGTIGRLISTGGDSQFGVVE